jgi:hypothetical protein
MPIEGLGDSIWSGLDSDKKAKVKRLKNFLKYFFQRMEGFRNIYREVFFSNKSLIILITSLATTN